MADAAGAPAPGEFTPDQIDRIQTITAGVMNAALTARLKSFEKQLHESLGKTIGEQLKSAAQSAKKDDDDGEPKEGKKSKSPQVDQVAVNTLQSQLAELNRRYEAAEKQAAEERDKNRATTLRQKLAEELSRVGVTNPEQQKIAIGYLVDARHAVKFDVEGGNEEKIVFDTGDGAVVNIDVGLRGWSKTPEAKFFMPPTGSKGAGSRPGGWNGQAAELTPAEKNQRVWAALAEEITK